MDSLDVTKVIAFFGALCFTCLTVGYLWQREKITQDPTIVPLLGTSTFWGLVFISVMMIVQFIAPASFIKLIDSYIISKISQPIPPSTEASEREINFEGKYIYKSEPIHNKEQIDKPALLIGEDRKNYYQFIGTAKISKDANTGSISVCGLRQFSVSLDSDKNVIINETDVHWNVDRTRAFLPQAGESEVIFILRTKLPRGKGLENGGSDSDHNLAIYLGKTRKTDIENGRAKKINGEMYYLNYHQQKNNQERMNPTWTHAEMVLKRVEDFGDDNEFISVTRASDNAFKAWFSEKFDIEINKINRPRSYRTKAPEENC